MASNVPTYHATKYDSARDEVVALLSDEAEGYGMRDDTTGDVDAPTGYVALVVIPGDVYLIPDGPIASARYGADSVAAEYDVTPEDVAGVHLVTTNSQGFVSVETFETEEEAREAFRAADTLYTRYVYGIPDSVSDEEVDAYVDAHPDPDGFV